MYIIILLFIKIVFFPGVGQVLCQRLVYFYTVACLDHLSQCVSPTMVFQITTQAKTFSSCPVSLLHFCPFHSMEILAPLIPWQFWRIFIPWEFWPISFNRNFGTTHSKEILAHFIPWKFLHS